MTPAGTASAPSALARRVRLLSLLEAAKRRGARFARISEIDQRTDQAQPAMYLKHDVHGLSPQALVEFAAAERELSAQGSYFFMTPDHPIARRWYSIDEQFEAMRQIQSLGHEIGLHFDPSLYLMAQEQDRGLGEILGEALRTFAAAGVPVAIGNLHGNSKFKMPDRNGFGTMFDLFDELGRQQDFPALSDVPEPTAALIRRHRMSLRALGLKYWADMPLWSARHGFVVLNHVTDNQLGKLGTVQFRVQSETIGQYKLADYQQPGAFTPSVARQIVRCPSTSASPSAQLQPCNVRVPLEDADCLLWFQRLATHPTVVLIHPEHYC